MDREKPFASQPSGGLVATTASLAQIHRELIIRPAAKKRLFAIHPYRLFVRSGGLMAYGLDVADLGPKLRQYCYW